MSVVRWSRIRSAALGNKEMIVISLSHCSDPYPRRGYGHQKGKAIVTYFVHNTANTSP